MSWSRKGALLGALLGFLIVTLLAFNANTNGGGSHISMTHMIFWTILGSLCGWGVGKVLSK